MANLQAVARSVLDVAYAQAARVAELGLAGHRHAERLSTASGPEVARDLADAVHFCARSTGGIPVSSKSRSAAPPGRCGTGCVKHRMHTSANGSISSG